MLGDSLSTDSFPGLAGLFKRMPGCKLVYTLKASDEGRAEREDAGIVG